MSACAAREQQAGFVLAGGKSSRMGADKALVRFDGQPMIQIALQTLAAAGLSGRIAGARSSLSIFAEEIPDTWKEAGPLGGIAGALAASCAPLNLFLPVDMPLMPPSLLALLLQRAAMTGAAVTVATLNGGMEPFPVVLRIETRRAIETRLVSGDRSCQSAWRSIPRELDGTLDAVAVEYLVQCGQCSHPGAWPPLLWFQSANTPGQLTRLSNLVRGGQKHSVNLDE